MKRKTIFIAAGVLVAAGAVAAVAAQGHRGWHGHGSMHGMEDREDWGQGRGFMRGPLTRTEHEAKTRERFARLDRNSDGIIDTGEIEASLTERMNARRSRMGQMGGGMGERMLRRFDENRDSKVTREEFNNTVRKRFVEFDLNNDGRISDDDLPPMMRGRGVLSEGDGAGFGRRRGGGMMGFIRGADTNKDGAITLEEAQAQAAKMFTQFDRNKDNAIDQSDRDAMRKEMVDYRVKRFVHHYGADRDGKVTREQFEKVAKDRFAEADFNNDGTITRDEMPGRGHWGGRGGDDQGPGERRGRGRMMGPEGGAGPAMGGPGMGGPGMGGAMGGSGPGRN